MDKKIILENMIKENRGALRQLTYLNNEIKNLKVRIKKLEDNNKVYRSEVELAAMHNLGEGNLLI